MLFTEQSIFVIYDYFCQHNEIFCRLRDSPQHYTLRSPIDYLFLMRTDDMRLQVKQNLFLLIPYNRWCFCEDGRVFNTVQYALMSSQ